jgi:hypothetical protein
VVPCRKSVQTEACNLTCTNCRSLVMQKHRERVAPLVLGALQRACEAAPPGGTASLPGPHIGGVPVCCYIDTIMCAHLQVLIHPHVQEIADVPQRCPSVIGRCCQHVLGAAVSVREAATLLWRSCMHALCSGCRADEGGVAGCCGRRRLRAPRLHRVLPLVPENAPPGVLLIWTVVSCDSFSAVSVNVHSTCAR